MEEMRLDPKHQFAAQYVLRAANERREREALLAAAAMNMSHFASMQPGLLAASVAVSASSLAGGSVSTLSESSPRISTPGDMKAEHGGMKSPFAFPQQQGGQQLQAQHLGSYGRLPSMSTDYKNLFGNGGRFGGQQQQQQQQQHLRMDSPIGDHGQPQAQAQVMSPTELPQRMQSGMEEMDQQGREEDQQQQQQQHQDYELAMRTQQAATDNSVPPQQHADMRNSDESLNSQAHQQQSQMEHGGPPPPAEQPVAPSSPPRMPADSSSEHAANENNDGSAGGGLFKHFLNSSEGSHVGSRQADAAEPSAASPAEGVTTGVPPPSPPPPAAGNGNGYSDLLMSRYRLEQISRHLHGFQGGLPFAAIGGSAGHAGGASGAAGEHA